MILKQYVRFTETSLNYGPIKHQNEDYDIIQKSNFGIETIVYTNTQKNNKQLILPGKSIYKKLKSRLGFYKFICSEIIKNNEKIVLIRVSSLDILLLPIIYKMNYKNVKVILVYHTIFDNKILMLSKAYHQICHWYCFGIAAPTQEILNFYKSNLNLKSYLVPNGVLMDGKKQIDLKIYEGDSLNLVFLASSHQSWHGLENLIKTLDARKNLLVKLHIIGRLNGENKENVIFYGHKEGEELTSLLALMDIGIGSFPPKDFPLQETSSLKHREYLRHGLPVFTGVYDILTDINPTYFRVDELKIEKILKFALEVKGANRIEVSNTYSHYIDRKIIIQKFFTIIIFNFS